MYVRMHAPYRLTAKQSQGHGEFRAVAFNGDDSRIGPEEMLMQTHSTRCSNTCCLSLFCYKFNIIPCRICAPLLTTDGRHLIHISPNCLLRT